MCRSEPGFDFVRQARVGDPRTGARWGRPQTRPVGLLRSPCHACSQADVASNGKLLCRLNPLIARAEVLAKFGWRLAKDAFEHAVELRE